MIMASAVELPVQGPKIMPNSSLSQVLQSDPVKRLFNQPNIVIHAIPRNNSPTAFRMVKQTPTINNKKNGINGDYKLSDESDVCIKISNTQSKEEVKQEINEDENLLPSKNNGKSEILLVPIIRKRKECGHFEPCESLVCDVNFQQHEENDEVTPLISINIEEDEIDAPVSQHCENEKCDALSIDHNRCRRGLIQIYRCDKCIVCDICGITFTTRKARVNHKKCRRKEIYRHNIATPTEIFKYRMRERELQILEAARLKRSQDYLDPVTGFSRTMEALMKKDELIIIAKTPPSQSKAPIPSLTPLYNNHVNHRTNVNNTGRKRKRAYSTDKDLTSEMISQIIQSCQDSINMKNQKENNNSLSPKQIKLTDHFNGATVNVMNTSSISEEPDSNALKPIKNQQVKSITDLPLNNVSPKTLQKFNVDHWIISNERYLKKPCKVSKAKIKSLPSKLHENQSLPTFSIGQDTSEVKATLKYKKLSKNKKLLSKTKKQLLVQQLPKLLPKSTQLANSIKFRPLQPAISGHVRNVDAKLGAVFSKKQKIRKRSRKKTIIKKRKFKCIHCPKRFSSIEYCKIHIAKHENDPSFFCRICEKGFLNKTIMMKHINADHTIGEVRCEVCDRVFPSTPELLKHIKTQNTEVKQECPECSNNFDTCDSLDVHMRKEHGFLICTICKQQVAKIKIKRHLMLEHSISKNRLETGLEKLSCTPGENDEVCEINLISKVIPKVEAVKKTEVVIENKIEADCLARGRTARRKSLKESFTCSVCDRHFENEKQLQIHLANNPMKFTQCPSCKKKFHRKAEYTEHSKTCSQNTVTLMEEPFKTRKTKLLNEEPILKKDSVLLQNSIDKKQNKTLKIIESKKLKLNHEQVVQREDKKDNVILKNAVDTKIVNGLKENSSNCLKNFKVNVQKNKDNDVINCSSKNVLLLNEKPSEINSIESVKIFDNSALISSINQDHNYL